MVTITIIREINFTASTFMHLYLHLFCTRPKCQDTAFLWETTLEAIITNTTVLFKNIRFYANPMGKAITLHTHVTCPDTLYP